MLNTILSKTKPTRYMANKLYLGLYAEKSLRNPKHDYESECWYMITINTL